jgi:transmembrane sensor
LISGYLKGELTPAETRELIEWIKLDKSNKRYYDECCEIWITAKAFYFHGYNIQKGFSKFKQKVNAGEDLHIDSIGHRLFRRIAKYAALLVITFSISGFLFYYIGKNQIIYPQKSFSELIVPMGSRAQFTLSDGTVVTLNAGSRLKYDNMFGLKDRVVNLEGEGYFKVVKNSAKPFTVKTSFLNVTAFGTEFNVKAYSNDEKEEATLVNGSVKIESLNEQNKGETTFLEPNQKVTLYKEGSGIVNETTRKGNNIQPLSEQKSKQVPILVKENVNVEPVVSWKENRWIFEHQSLSEIAVELERRFDIQINFESERLKAFRFTGTIIAEPIEQVLEVISISAPIGYKLKGRVITLSENKNFEELNKGLYNQNK